MSRRWTAFITSRRDDPRARMAGLVIYYLAILAGLILLYGQGNFYPPPFIYQGF